MSVCIAAVVYLPPVIVLCDALQVVVKLPPISGQHGVHQAWQC